MSSTRWRRAWPSPASARSGSRSSLRPVAARPASRPRTRCADRAARAEMWARLRPSADRADDDRAVGEQVDHRLGGLARVGDAAEHDDQALALGGAQRVHARGAGEAAYLVEDVGLGALGRGGARATTATSPRGRPAEGAGPGEHGLVGLGPQHGVDDQRLEPGVPGAADLGGAGVDLGGRERDLAGVAEHRGVHLGRVVGVEDLVDVALDDLDREPDQVDGLLEVDHPGQRTRGGAEHRGGEGGGSCGVLAGGRGTSRRSRGYRPGRSCPTQDRSSALSSRNHGMSVSMRAIAVVLRAPVERCSASAARSARVPPARVGTRVEVSPGLNFGQISHERRVSGSPTATCSD